MNLLGYQPVDLFRYAPYFAGNLPVIKNADIGDEPGKEIVNLARFEMEAAVLGENQQLPGKGMVAKRKVFPWGADSEQKGGFRQG